MTEKEFREHAREAPTVQSAIIGAIISEQEGLTGVEVFESGYLDDEDRGACNIGSINHFLDTCSPWILCGVDGKYRLSPTLLKESEKHSVS
jgi:hypothetical protein